MRLRTRGNELEQAESGGERMENGPLPRER